MKYQFIEQHKQEFPVVVMCNVLGVEGSVAFMLGASVLQALANEKMLNSRRRFGRSLSPIEADMAARAFIVSCKIRGEAHLANEWPG